MPDPVVYNENAPERNMHSCKLRKQRTTNEGEDVGKREPSLAGELQTGTATVQIS